MCMWLHRTGKSAKPVRRISYSVARHKWHLKARLRAARHKWHLKAWLRAARHKWHLKAQLCATRDKKRLMNSVCCPWVSSFKITPGAGHHSVDSYHICFMLTTPSWRFLQQLSEVNCCDYSEVYHAGRSLASFILRLVSTFCNNSAWMNCYLQKFI